MVIHPPTLGSPPVNGEAIRALLSRVTDPEIPVLTIDDLGVLRDVEVEAGSVTVTITPTYSGCPAMDAIRADIRLVLVEAGFEDIQIRTVYAPAWTTDWMSGEAKQRLQEFGIAPPGQEIRCPNCEGSGVSTVSYFGSTACKALMVCDGCGEPFDRFKDL